MSDYSSWLTLREIDAAAGTAKGTAFRHFRVIEAQLEAGRDYRLLRHADDREAIAALRSARRIYSGSINVVLLTERLAQQIVEVLRDVPGGPR